MIFFFFVLFLSFLEKERERESLNTDVCPINLEFFRSCVFNFEARILDSFKGIVIKKNF